MVIAVAAASAVLVCPVTTERRRSSNGGWRTSESLFVSVVGDRTTNYCWTGAGNDQQQRFLSLLGMGKMSSPLPSRVSKRILCFYSGSSSRNISSPPTNARDESELRGLDECSVLIKQSVSAESELGHPEANKDRSLALAATPETEIRCLEFEQASASPERSFWKGFQRGGAAFAVVMASVVIACTFMPKAVHALAENSIGASSLGIKVADFLRGSGLSDELVVLTVATLPVLELRGAIPISYWLKVEPVKGYIMAVIGNMIPVPFIVLYLDKVLKAVGEKGETGSKFVQWVVDRTRKKAGPIEEFKWLGLLLFVAVPLPGTGAWSGAICASILGMPFWDAVTANFFGVALAGLLVTLLVRVGTKEAVLVGIAMIVSSCFVWSVLRLFQQKKKGASSS